MPLWKVDKRNIFKNEIRFLEKEGAILLGQIQIQENYMNNKQNQNLKVDRYDLNELLPSFENSSNNWNKDRYTLHFFSQEYYYYSKDLSTGDTRFSSLDDIINAKINNG